MKKLLIFFGMFVLTITAFSLPASANGQLFSPDSDNRDDFLNDGLNPGETIVDFYRESIPVSELETAPDMPTLEKFQGDEITPYERRLSWYPTKKAYLSLAYSSWLYAGASTTTGGSLSASHTSTISNTYSGQLTTTIGRLDAFVGFGVTYSTSKTVGYTSHSTPSGRYRLEYRHVYKRYNVKQEKKYDPRASASYGTAYVYPQQWVERQYRVVKF